MSIPTPEWLIDKWRKFVIEESGLPTLDQMQKAIEFAAYCFGELEEEESGQ